jgi:hypothetical protein
MPHSLASSGVIQGKTAIDPTEYSDPDLTDSRSVEDHMTAIQKSLFLFETEPILDGFRSLLDRLVEKKDLVSPSFETVSQLIKASAIFEAKRSKLYSSKEIERLVKAKTSVYAPTNPSDVMHALWYSLNYSSRSLLRDKITLQYRYRTTDPITHTVLGHAGVVFPWSVLVTPIVRLEERDALSISVDRVVDNVVKRILLRLGRPRLSPGIVNAILLEPDFKDPVSDSDS